MNEKPTPFRRRRTDNPDRQMHPHPLGIAILRDQLHDGDRMLEAGTGEPVVRMRTELRPETRACLRPELPTEPIPAPRPAPTGTTFMPAVLAELATSPMAAVL